MFAVVSDKCDLIIAVFIEYLDGLRIHGYLALINRGQFHDSSLLLQIIIAHKLGQSILFESSQFGSESWLTDSACPTVLEGNGRDDRLVIVISGDIDGMLVISVSQILSYYLGVHCNYKSTILFQPTCINTFIACVEWKKSKWKGNW